jgi:hypothetical protein
LGQAFFEATPDSVWAVAVWLRPSSLPVVPDCPGDSARDARCAERDQALTERQLLNVQEVNCALGVLSDRVTNLAALWYELPYHLTTGAPVPIGFSLRLLLTGPQIALLASHPFVERIEPAPGTVPGSGIAPPAPPDDCPTSSDDPGPKLSRLVQIQGKGRQPALIDLDVSERVLPASGDWERTILNTREATCIKRRVDAIVTEASPRIGYQSIRVGSAGALPPVGQSSVVTLVVGQGLTWDEAMLLAAHPYVASIWTFDGLQYEPPPPPGCPPDLDAPVPAVACTDEREPIDGKFFDAQRAQLEAATSPVGVGIMLSGGATVCPTSQCSVPPCPDLVKFTERWKAENTASQRCVRDLIASLGGTSSPEVFSGINVFFASLTWEQMRAVAAYPQVKSLERASGSPPPAP